MKKLITLLGTLALATTLSSVSFAQQDQSAPSSPSAQQPATSQPDQDQSGQQPSSPSQDSSMQATPASSFTGIVAKVGGKYVLKTSDSNYQLDDQQKAKQFVGKQVKVSGNLDASSSTIHVSDITPVS